MPTFKTTDPTVLALYDLYAEAQSDLQNYFDSWAPRFGMTKAVLRERPFDCTYFDGFRGPNLGPNGVLWRETAHKGERPGIWWLRKAIPRGHSSPARLRMLRDFCQLWEQMLKNAPGKTGGRGVVEALPWLQALGFHNHLDFFNHGRVSMVFTRTAILLKLEQGVPPKLGEIWEEILGSEYERLAAENAAELAREHAEKEAANAACAEMTRQNQELGLYD